MAAEIIDPYNRYVLGVGSSEERSIPMLKEVSISREFDAVDPAMRQLYQAAREHPSGKPQALMIRGTWIVWCYAAHEVENLRTELASLREEHKSMQARLAELSDQVTELKGSTS